MKKITVLMLTYNHENYISKALESVLSQQTKYNFEILIGDDFSPDNTIKILKEYKKNFPKKIKLVIRKKNIGPKENFLDLISKADGDYIALLEGDDYWKSNFKLEKMIDFLENQKEYIGAFHNVEVVNEKNEYKKNHYLNENNRFTDINSLQEFYEGKNMLTLSIVFKNIFLNTIDIKEYRKMLDGVKYICDFNLKAYLLNIGKFKYFNEIMGAYRHVDNYGTSWSAQSDEIKNKDLLIIYKKNIEKFEKISKEYLLIPYFGLIKKMILFYIKEQKWLELIKVIKEFKWDLLIKLNTYLKLIERIRNAK
ncbi:MAG: glycosyltransferase [Cetobacterium sp.]